MSGSETLRRCLTGERESVVTYLGCGLWMNMSCVSESIIQHCYDGGVVCSSRRSHMQQCPQSTVQHAVYAARLEEGKDTVPAMHIKFQNVVVLCHQNSL